jgi:nucleoside-diphosphate-sugar epimerase
MTRRGVVLVTGAAGGIGSALIPVLERAGWTVRALVHERPVSAASEFVRGSLDAPATLAEACDGVDGVLHLAAVTHARRGRAYMRVNVEGTRNLCDAARTSGVARFVLGSSRSATEGGGAYCASKLRSEEEVRGCGVEFVIVRLPEIYGSNGREGTETIRRQAARGAPIPIVGAGNETICPTHLNDVLEPLGRALEIEQAAGHTYTLGGECVSVRAYAEACIASSGSKSRIVSVPTILAVGLANFGRLPGVPVYPDQVTRLRAKKPSPSPEASAHLGFAPRSLSQGLGEAT